MVTLNDVKKNKELETYIQRGDESLAAMGFTEHGFRHVELVASIAGNVLLRLGYSKREAELASIAGYLHDVGNMIARHGHPESGAQIAWKILREMGMEPYELALVVSAIGNHEEAYGHAVNPISAALILADKTDVHRTRVRNKDLATFDIHDRVNYAVTRSFLRVGEGQSSIVLELTVDTEISPVMDYFEIFLSRMMLCRRAATYLGRDFGLVINNAQLL